MIKIDLGDLEKEILNLSTFIESKNSFSITVMGKELIIDSGKEVPSARNVKELVKQFLHHKVLSESYRVIEENEVVRITKRKQESKLKTRKKGKKPSSYDTLPYFFPNRPLVIDFRRLKFMFRIAFLGPLLISRIVSGMKLLTVLFRDCWTLKFWFAK